MRQAARPLSIVVILILGLVSTGRVAADPPDPRTLLQQAATAMGGASPADSKIDATITIEIGGATYSGTVEYRSLGDDKTREIHDVPDRDRDTTFDHGYAKLDMGEEAKPLPPQLAASAQAFAFPLVLANAYLNNPEAAFEYVGTDVIDGNTVHVVKAWDTAARELVTAYRLPNDPLHLLQDTAVIGFVGALLPNTVGRTVTLYPSTLSIVDAHSMSFVCVAMGTSCW